MEISFKVNDIIQQLRQVSSVVAPKSSLLILENVIWKKVNNELSFVASDSETWITVGNVPMTSYDTNESFEICLNAKDTLSVLQNLSGEEVELNVNIEKKVVNGRYGRKGTFMLPFSEVDEFPRPKEITDWKKVSVPTSMMTECIQSVVFSVANDELRPVMNTIHFDFTERDVISVASDGRKLARFTRLGVSSPAISGKSFNLPNKPATLLSRVITSNQDTETLDIYTDDASAVKFKIGDNIINTRLIDARFPNYNMVIPQDNDKDFVVAKDDVLGILKRILPLGDAGTECVILHYNVGTQEILFSTEDIDWSKSASEAAECDTDVREDIVIGFKGSELINVIQNVPSDKIRIKIKDKTHAALIVPAVENPNFDYTSILMPMLINQ